MEPNIHSFLFQVLCTIRMPSRQGHSFANEHFVCVGTNPPNGRLTALDRQVSASLSKSLKTSRHRPLGIPREGERSRDTEIPTAEEPKEHHSNRERQANEAHGAGPARNHHQIEDPRTGKTNPSQQSRNERHNLHRVGRLH